MINKLKRVILKGKKFFLIASIASLTAITSIVSVGAEGFDMGSLITSAGTTIESGLDAMAKSLTPVLVSIAMIGVGVFAIFYLFSAVKAIFTKMAGK